VSPPNEGRPGEGRPKNQTTLPTPSSYTEGHDAASFGMRLDRPLTTTRTCAGEFCWCHVGREVPYPHWQYMDTLAREIRKLDILQGVQL